ncbi:hypothetical protein [Paenibacillus sp. sgz500958]|uniref:hypothetical protein n=1 Tax=Paenibacillus sp. sgz500958 TaxID=3242475 RepID=UPI0036D2E1BD
MIRMNHGKQYIWMICGTAVLLACALLLPRWSGTSPALASVGEAAQRADENAVVATVNGYAVTLKEFKVRMPEQRAETMTYYQQTYGCDPAAASFWSTPCGGEGEIPQERLKQVTLQLLVEDRVRELAASQAGLNTAIGYDAFLAEWEEENRERAESAAAGKVIYGPRQYSEVAYYRYTVSNTVLGLKEWLTEQDGLPTEEQLRQEYEDSIARQPEPPSFETARDALVQEWTEKRYGRWFAEQVKQAAVEIDQQVYAGIRL